MTTNRTVTVRAASGPGTNIDIVGDILSDLMKRGVQVEAQFDPGDSTPEVVHYTVSSTTDEEGGKAEEILRQYLDARGYTFEQ